MAFIMAEDIGFPIVPFLIAQIGKCTNVLEVLGVVLVNRMQSQLIRPDQFQRFASVAAALRCFCVNPQFPT